MPETYLDDDGYPEDEALRIIREWAWESGWHELLAYARVHWIWPDYFERKGNTYEVSTGGWSGHEALIGALQENRLFWVFCWQQSRRGGHYTFVVPNVPDGPC